MEDNNILTCEYNNQYTKDELDILNMEVTPEIEAVLATMLMEKAMKDALSYVPMVQGPDTERTLLDNLDLFEDYISLTNERAPYQAKWETPRYARNMWWSLFKEEMDYNWMELDLFEGKLEGRMRLVTPTEDQWNKAKAIRKMIYGRCIRTQNRRRTMTYGIYLKAKAATEKCQAFWKTADGIKLSNLNDMRSSVWNAITDLDCTWEDYNNLVNLEFNKYWTTGDTEEIDGMELMANTITEYMDMLEDASHSEDAEMDAVESKASGYWNHRNAAKSFHVAKDKVLADETEEAYQRSLVDFMDTYLCGTNNTLSSENGAHC